MDSVSFQKKVKDLLNKVHSSKAEKNNVLPGDCCFLNDDEFLCNRRKFGDSRYPYSVDGLTLWAYSSGNVKIEESTFNILLDFCEGKEPNLAFYTGVKEENGYFPVSITGAGKLPFERNVERYAVFTPDAAYYFVETEQVVSCVRMFVDGERNIRFSLYAENISERSVETYLSAYFNCMLSHSNYEYIETKWYRSSKAVENGFRLSVTECIDRNTCLEHKASIVRDCKTAAFSTTSHTDFCGGMHNQLCCSTPLQTRRFEENKEYTEFTDTAIAGDIIPLILDGGESVSVSYTLTLSETPAKNATTGEIDALLYVPKAFDAFGMQIPVLKAKGMWNNVSGELFGAFVKNVFRQAEFCTRAKNYAGPYIGIRDIFQQMEASLMWIPDYVRGKIVEALNYIGENGRAPRQYSYVQNKNVLPSMDLRAFVDQGVWIISTVYKYLAYTGDYSILDEVCGYYKFDGNKVDFCTEKDSILSHLVRITEYLVSNLDEKTNCLHALYGDWNDALDGLGKTQDENREYGTGVSVMATLQFYQNLGEMSEILRKLDKEADAERYDIIREKVCKGLQKYAIVENKKGERKILHGWFDKREDFVGSFCDYDGNDRDGLTANAFWIISDMIQYDNSLKSDILSAYERLDSKYGLKTFEPYFAKGNNKVGRINRLPKGTAENGATYIHATLFGIWSLFKVGEYEKAWEQLYKILPITHGFISTTPFVMPNSYSENPEKGFDGESMSDWFTGSGCVLLKVLLWYVFGVQADLNGVWISAPKYMPFERMSLSICVKGKKHDVVYIKNEENITLLLDGVSQAQTLEKGRKIAL